MTQPIEDPPAIPPNGSVRELLQAARRQHHAGAGATLDVLLRQAGAQSSALLEKLHAEAGVAALLDTTSVEPDFSVLDRETARAWRCVVLSRTGQPSCLGLEDPWDEALLMRIGRRLRQQLEPVAVRQAALRTWLGESDSTASTAVDPSAGPLAEGPIVAFVDTAIRAGFAAGASDIHFECDRTGVSVKHRLDGVMTAFARLDSAQAAQETISRIKVLAQLDITERRLPQDGRFRFRVGAGEIDLRVSIMPSVFGEDAVLRLLDKAQLRGRSATVSLALLGFEDAHAEVIRTLASEPSGMLLVTGPTGSGKTTTLYAVLSEINTGLEKIITIEDPVEYELPGVLQIPVNERKGLTFAKGLRSILRHDPDRILIGEIRDAETAEIAVQSALTGHQVFTTVHANSMGDIMGRFRHFGLDMFGFMSSLNGVLVQRLIRRLCPTCAASRSPDERERQWLQAMGRPDVIYVPQATGCSACHGTGYKGRFVLAEVHLVDDALRDLVTEGAPLSAIKQHAQHQRVLTLASQAARQVVAGRTTLEEIKRVVGWL
jgi:general secretion pathway protein E